MKKSAKPLEGGTTLAGAQLGLQEEAVRLKTLCAAQLNDYLDTLKWTQQRIGRELGLSQPHVSELRNYALDRFSADRLLQFMATLGMNVSIRIELPKLADENASDEVHVTPVTIEIPPVRKADKKVA